MLKHLLLSLLFAFGLFTTTATANVQAADTAKMTQEERIALEQSNYHPQSVTELIQSFFGTTGLNAMVNPEEGLVNGSGDVVSTFAQGWGRALMFLIIFVLFYLAIGKGFEPLLLLPIAFGGLLANIPIADMAAPGHMLGIIYEMGIANEFFPLLIFMGVGAMTDFGPLLANPKTALLGGAAQFGIFGSLVGAAALSQYTGMVDFTLQQSAAISIIGGADGPTSIFIASALAPELLGAIAVAAYSYMALVPVIQPPIMRALTTKAERQIVMTTKRKVHRMEKLIFPLVVIMMIALVLPDAAPLMGSFAFGNFAKESGVVDRLSNEMQNSLINIVTIFLGFGVGMTLQADKFLVAETMGIMIIGLLAFSAGTAAGVLMARLMNKFSSDPINPLIGAAGVSAVPMAARVASKVGSEEKPGNILLMHAMGPNVAGVIGSAVAAGVLLSIFK